MDSAANRIMKDRASEKESKIKRKRNANQMLQNKIATEDKNDLQ